MDAGWVSSKSSPCASAPLTRTASGAVAVRSVPSTVQGPCSPATRVRSAGAKSARAPARARPTVSRTRSRTLSTTSVGSVSKRSAAVKRASRSATVMTRPRGHSEGGRSRKLSRRGHPRLERQTAPSLQWLAGQRDVAVAFATAQRDHLSPFGVGDLDLLDQAGVEHLLDERLALVARRRQLVRLPAHDEIATAHVRQPRLGALELRHAALETFLGRYPWRHARERWAREPAQRDRTALTLGQARTLHLECGDTLAQMDVPEAPHAQIGRELLRRPRRHPHLLAERVHRLHRRHEIIVARHENGRVVGPIGRVVDEVGHETGIHALLGRVLVLAAAHVAAAGPPHAGLPLHEIPRAELETLEEGLHQRRSAGGHTDVVVGATEHRAAATDLLRDPGGKPIVVDAKRLVVAKERAVEVLTVKENADLHAQLPSGIGSEQSFRSSAESYHGRPGHEIAASSVRVSPLVSTQLTWILSPGLPPANVNWRKGFLDTAGPHCADSTGLP